MEILDFIPIFFTIYLFIFLFLDLVFFLFGTKVEIKDIYISCLSNSSKNKIKFYVISASYSYCVNGENYHSSLVNFSFYPCAINQKKIYKKIDRIKRDNKAYVLKLFPGLSCLAPFFYSKFLMFLIILVGPISLFFGPISSYF